MDQDTLKLLKALLGIIGLSSLAAFARSALQEDRRNLLSLIRGLVMALFVGTVTAMVLYNYNFPILMIGAIVSVFAFTADDILMLTVALSTKLKNNPDVIWNWFLKRSQNDTSTKHE